MAISSNREVRASRLKQITYSVRLPPTDAVGTTGTSAALATAIQMQNLKTAAGVAIGAGSIGEGYLPLDGALSASWLYRAKTTSPEGMVYLALPTTINFAISVASTLYMTIVGRDQFLKPVTERVYVTATTLARSKYAYSYIESILVNRGDAADATTIAAGWHWRNNASLNQAIPLPFKMLAPMGQSASGSGSTVAATGKLPPDIISAVLVNLGGGAAGSLSVGAHFPNVDAVSGGSASIDYAASTISFASGGAITQPTAMQEWMVTVNADALARY